MSTLTPKEGYLSRFREYSTQQYDRWLNLLAIVFVFSVVVITERVESRYLTTAAILFLFVLGALARTRPRWQLGFHWWLSWAVYLVTTQFLINPTGTARIAVAYGWWVFLLVTLLLVVLLTLWQRRSQHDQGQSYIALLLLPWSLESIRFTLFAELSISSEAELRGWAMYLIGLVIYLVVGALAYRRPGEKIWRLLWFVTTVHLLLAVVLSMPIPLFFIVFPSLFLLFLIVSLGPLLLPWMLSEANQRSSLPWWRRGRLAAVGLLVVAGLLLPWSSGDALPLSAESPSKSSSINPVPLIIDTDLSQDDYVAILYLLLHDGVDIRAFTISEGIARVGPGYENLRRLLFMVGRDDIPVAIGQADPLRGDNTFPPYLHSPNEVLFRLLLPKPPIDLPPHADAAETITSVVEASTEPITLIGLGTMTNIAQALIDSPALADQFQSLVISGGAIHVPGNINADMPSHPNTVSEWNLYIDPYANEVVFESGANIELFPLDVTSTDGPKPVLLRTEMVNQFVTLVNSRESHLMSRLMKVWLLTGIPTQSTAVPMWDLVVAVALTDPELCTTWEEFAIQIPEEPQALAGQTQLQAGGVPNTAVCMAGDQSTLDQALINVLAE